MQYLVGKIAYHVRLIATELFAVLIMVVTFVHAIFAPTVQEFFIRGGIFFFVTVFGVLLIRGTLREIRALRELSDAKTEFISIASHQLRTPLSVIKGYLSLLEEGTFGEMKSEQRDVVKKVYMANEGMIRLVNDLLNVSRADQGRLEYVFHELELGEVVDGVIERFRLSAGQKGVTLDWERPDEPTMVHADEDKIAQVISNLVDNAIKYTEHGGIVIRISHEEGTRQNVRVYIKDSGVGIAQEELAGLFQRFNRARGGERISSSGSGLGLYIAKKVTEGHHGCIWVESEGEGRGSTFAIELPLAGSERAPHLGSTARSLEAGKHNSAPNRESSGAGQKLKKL
ncbi:MAG: HAMP domain-containing sensor histidine kinase [Candidatus Spechtbacterales bacterium]